MTAAAGLAALLLAGGSACGGGGDGSARPTAPPRLTLTTIARGLDKPADISSPGDGTGRLFISEKAGMVRLFDGDFLVATPFADFTDIVDSGADERGLLSIAFHPDFKTNGHFYIAYTASGPLPEDAGDVVIAEYQVSADPDVADESSGKILFSAEHSATIGHNDGQLQFGPDGYLYIGIGDGDLQDAPADNAQNLELPLGKILRIDVRGGSGYTVPATNPFVGKSGMAEIWAYGLRNPWRFSFDRLTGDLFIGDVGQDAFEEVNFQPAASAGGENYGWPRLEGTTCLKPPNGCDDGTSRKPILVYGREGGGCSVTAGYRYREPASSLDGLFIYGDFCSGVIWGAREAGGLWKETPLLDSSLSITTFGQDEAGRLYVADFSHGTVHRLEPR